MTEREHIAECQSWLVTAHHRLEQGDIAATEIALNQAVDHAHCAAVMRAGG